MKNVIKKLNKLIKVCVSQAIAEIRHFPDFKRSKLNTINFLFPEMPRQLRKTQAFPEMPDFRKCLPHVHKTIS
jgi:hypothetical protein